MAVDTSIANRLKDEMAKIKEVLENYGDSHVEDPLGVDGVVKVERNSFRITGAGDVILLKENDQGDRRFTRFRSWGPMGDDYVEKTSYLIKNNGTTKFFKKRVEPGDEIISLSEPEDSDIEWIDGID